MPPSVLRSTKLANSMPYPNVPEAAKTGFRSFMPHRSMASLESGIYRRASSAGCNCRRGSYKSLRGCSNQAPCIPDVLLGRLEVTDGETQYEGAVQHRVRKECFTGCVDFSK